jgi:hypothetical protein
MMSLISRSRARSVAHLAGVLVCVLLAAAGCQKTVESPAPSGAATAADAAPPERKTEGVTLSPEEIGRMGIVIVAARAMRRAPEATGFAVVLTHEAIAQAVADLAAAQAVAHQSRAALERTQRLAGTAGAMPADVQESAERQAIVDQSALELVQHRLLSTFGQNPPWKNHAGVVQLSALASGTAQLVRVTFSLDSLGTSDPATLRLARINASQGGASFDAAPVWSAPADAAMPGRSYFAYLKSGHAGEGERLLAWAASGAPESGTEIPAAATVISGGKYWCYVEEKAGSFVRHEIDPALSTAAGYFVKEGIAPGDKIVGVAAGQLLALETGSSAAAD